MFQLKNLSVFFSTQFLATAKTRNPAWNEKLSTRDCRSSQSQLFFPAKWHWTANSKAPPNFYVVPSFANCKLPAPHATQSNHLHTQTATIVTYLMEGVSYTCKLHLPWKLKRYALFTKPHLGLIGYNVKNGHRLAQISLTDVWWRNLSGKNLIS